MADTPPPLEYEDPRARENRPSPIVALGLCAPGAATFGFLFLGEAHVNFSVAVNEAIGDVVWPLWFAAVVTAIISLVLYRRYLFRPLPWYVFVNLCVNVPGLLLSVLIFLLSASCGDLVRTPPAPITPLVLVTGGTSRGDRSAGDQHRRRYGGRGDRRRRAAPGWKNPSSRG